MTDPGIFISDPCRHKLCGDCWTGVMIVQKNNNCPYCQSKIEKIIPLEHVENKKHLSLLEGYSCVYTDDFVYRIGEEVEVEDFDEDLKKICSNGIHYHTNVNDVFQWFEYLDIPEGLRNNIPW